MADHMPSATACVGVTVPSRKPTPSSPARPPARARAPGVAPAGAEVEDALALVQLGDRDGVAAAEAGQARRLGQRVGVRVVETGPQGLPLVAAAGRGPRRP